MNIDLHVNTNHIEDASFFYKKYRTEIPNIVDDMKLTPYALSLYLHIKRVTGQNGKCYQKTKTLAKHCRMSVGKVVYSKKELVEKKLINISIIKTDRGNCHSIEVNDIWKENFLYFENRKKIKAEESLSSRVQIIDKCIDELKLSLKDKVDLSQLEDQFRSIKNAVTINKENSKKNLVVHDMNNKDSQYETKKEHVLLKKEQDLNLKELVKSEDLTVKKEVLSNELTNLKNTLSSSKEKKEIKSTKELKNKKSLELNLEDTNHISVINFLEDNYIRTNTLEVVKFEVLKVVPEQLYPKEKLINISTINTGLDIVLYTNDYLDNNLSSKNTKPTIVCVNDLVSKKEPDPELDNIILESGFNLSLRKISSNSIEQSLIKQKRDLDKKLVNKEDRERLLAFTYEMYGQYFNYGIAARDITDLLIAKIPVEELESHFKECVNQWILSGGQAQFRPTWKTVYNTYGAKLLKEKWVVTKPKKETANEQRIRESRELLGITEQSKGKPIRDTRESSATTAELSTGLSNRLIGSTPSNRTYDESEQERFKQAKPIHPIEPRSQSSFLQQPNRQRIEQSGISQGKSERDNTETINRTEATDIGSRTGVDTETEDIRRQSSEVKFEEYIPVYDAQKLNRPLTANELRIERASRAMWESRNRNNTSK